MSDEWKEVVYSYINHLRNNDVKKSTKMNFIMHEIRNPLHTIGGYAELGSKFLAKGNDPAKINNCFVQIKNIENRLKIFLNDLLFYTKLDMDEMPFTFEDCNIVSLFKTIIKELEPSLEERNIVINLKNEFDDIQSNIDIVKFHQAILNIVNNSIKFSEDDNSINIDVSVINGLITIMIEDFGLGVAEDEIDFIFDEFYQTKAGKNKKEGVGLGLPIVKKIIGKHSGHINCIHKDGGLITKIELKHAKDSNIG